METVTWAGVTEPATSRSHCCRFSACSNPSSPPATWGAGAPITPELTRRPEAEGHTWHAPSQRVLVPPRAGSGNSARPHLGAQH